MGAYPNFWICYPWLPPCYFHPEKVMATMLCTCGLARQGTVRFFLMSYDGEGISLTEGRLCESVALSFQLMYSVMRTWKLELRLGKCREEWDKNLAVLFFQAWVWGGWWCTGKCLKKENILLSCDNLIKAAQGEMLCWTRSVQLSVPSSWMIVIFRTRWFHIINLVHISATWLGLV